MPEPLPVPIPQTGASPDTAARIAAFDWSKTPLGPLSSWSHSLRTTVNLCLTSRFPMFVWWGPELINIYNDAYALQLGKRHPGALGMPAAKVWSEIWSMIEEDTYSVVRDGKAIVKERVRFLMERNGYPEETYYTYSHSPVLDDDGKIRGLFQVCIDETGRVKAESERDRLAIENRRVDEQAKTILESISDGFFAVDRQWRFSYLNSMAERILDRTSADLIGKGIWDEYPLLVGTEFERLYRRVQADRQAGTTTAYYADHQRWYEVHVYPAPDDGISVYFQNVSDRKQLEIERERLLAERENQRARLAEVITHAPAFMCMLRGPDHVYELANQKYEELVGRRELIGKTIRDAIPEAEGQGFFEILDDVYRTGKAFTGNEVPIRLRRGSNQALVERYINFIYQPTRDSNGQIDGIFVHGVDVTDLVAHRQAIIASESAFRKLADAMPQIVWAARADGVLDYYNRRWFEYINQPPTSDQVQWEQYIHPDDQQRVFAEWRRCVHSGELYSIEFRVADGKGVYRWFLVRAEASRDEDGNIARWYGTCTDIEDRKRSEALDRFLLSLDAEIRVLTDPAQISATHARLLGEYLQADRCAYADVEDDQDTFNLIGDYNRGVPSIVGRYRFIDFGQECLNLMRADKPYVVEDIDTHQPPVDVASYRLTMIQSVICVPLHKDGRFVAAMAVHQKVPRKWTPDQIDLVRRVAARCWESIERSRVERALRETEEFHRFAAEAGRTGAWYVRLDNFECSLSPVMTELMDFPAGQTVASVEQWNAAVVPEDRPAMTNAIQTTIDTGAQFDIEFRITRADGGVRWLHSHGGLVRDAAGKPLRLHGASVDITDRKRAEEEREKLLASERSARSQAEHISRMKDEFLATLSHELRTPLSAILGWSQIINRPSTKPEDISQGLDVIQRNARAQAQIIEDLLDMSRIISGKVRLDVQRLDLATIVQTAVDTARPTADTKGVRLQSVIDPLQGIVVSGDANRLQQVLWNLLSNAIKFTPRDGRVQVLVERVNSHIEISVIDTGEGISPDFLPYVFDRFRQADASTTRRHGGLGLGLSIVKQLVELHGGSVRAKSGGPGKGSTFMVHLPVTVLHTETHEDQERRHPRSPAQHQSPSDLCLELHGVRVLVVDDERDARALVKRLLEDCKATVTTASSASEALDLIQRHTFDVMVSDVGMPGEDGYSLIKRLRALPPDKGGNLPAVALTAYARAEDRVRAISAGFLMHVSKPVEPMELVTMVAGAAGRIGR